MRRIHEENGRPEVFSVTVEIGALQLVVPDALDTAFKALTHETEFEQTELIQEVIPARGVCKQCETEQEREELYSACVECGSYNFRMMTGLELNLTSMEVGENV